MSNDRANRARAIQSAPKVRAGTGKHKTGKATKRAKSSRASRRYS